MGQKSAVAWGIEKSFPLDIVLTDLSASLYCQNVDTPKVKVSQDLGNGPERAGVMPQLENIIMGFFKEQWQAFKDRGGVYYQDLKEAPVAKKDESANVQLLMGMGFKKNEVLQALKDVDDDLDQAIAYLTGDKKKILKNKKAIKNEKRSANPNASIHNSIIKAEEKKRAFKLNFKTGLLVGLLEYVRYRLQSLNEFCPLCDLGHMFGAPMLKPAVCRRELCNFAFSKLGLMADTVDGVAMQAEVVDLLVAMFKAAAFSARAVEILNPFPLVFDPVSEERRMFCFSFFIL